MILVFRLRHKEVVAIDRNEWVISKLDELPSSWEIALNNLLDPSTAFFSSGALQKTLKELVMAGEAYIAGGCFKDLFRGTSPKDIDLFFESEEAFKAAADKFRALDASVEESYANSNCVAFKGDGLTVELVRAQYGEPKTIVEGFDLTLGQCALIAVNGELVLLAKQAFHDDFKDKVVRFSPGAQDRPALERLHRYDGYNFKVEKEVLSAAMARACSEYGCAAQDSYDLDPRKFFGEVGLFASYGDLQGLARSSFGGAHLLSEHALHSIYHTLESFKGYHDYRKAVSYKTQTALRDIDPRVKNLWGINCSPALTSLVELLGQVQHKMTEAGRTDLIALLYSASVTSNKSVWATSEVLILLIRKAQELDAWHDFEAFLRDLMAWPSRSLGYGEWLEFLNADEFSYSTPIFAVMALYGEEQAQSVSDEEIWGRKDAARKVLLDQAPADFLAPF